MALGRWTSIALQVLGFAGLALCLALAIAILLGRSWVSTAVGDAFVAADTSIADGLVSIDDATGRLTGGAGTLDELLGELGPIPATTPIPAAMSARISAVVESVAPARDRFVTAREQARVALSNMQLAGRVVPGVEVPTGVTDVLTAADDRLGSIDAALTGLRSSARATAGDVAAALTTLRSAVTTAADTARSLRAEIEGLRGRIADVHARVDRGLWLGTGGLLLVVGYVALLNAVIVWLARRRPKLAPVGEPSEAVPEANPSP